MKFVDSSHGIFFWSNLFQKNQQKTDYPNEEFFTVGLDNLALTGVPSFKLKQLTCFHITYGINLIAKQNNFSMKFMLFSLGLNMFHRGLTPRFNKPLSSLYYKTVITQKYGRRIEEQWGWRESYNYKAQDNYTSLGWN